MIQIIDTGVANIRSLQAAFDRLGKSWSLTTNADEVAKADHVVLPGVGTFAAAVDRIDQFQLREPLIARIENDLPTLCICLGMQILCEGSEENVGASGLGIVPRSIKRFGDDVQVPQLGWNEVVPAERKSRYGAGLAYFANSFRLTEPPPPDWSYAETKYGDSFVSSIWRGNVLACQFHPELSGAWGEGLIKRWSEC